MEGKPKIFIGSSSEGIEIAQAVCEHLEKVFRVDIWNEDIFKLGLGNLESLMKVLDKFDFAVFILTPDDTIESRGLTSQSPRDNVIFECGLFTGRLGRERTFLVYNENSAIKIPSDWLGVTHACYKGEQDITDLLQQVRPACSVLKRAIKSKGIRNHSEKLRIRSLVSEFRGEVTKLDRNIQHIVNIIRSEKGAIDSIYNERATHYKTEKRVMAEPFLEEVLGERVKYLQKTQNKSDIRIIFDAGTTIEPIMDVLGRKAEDDRAHWCKNIPIVTNNIKGVQNMLRYREYPNNRYSELTIRNFSVLPGKVLAPFEAIADETTLKALETYRDDNVYTIAVTTGNYILVHNHQFASIARGGFHPHFKATLYDIADEVYVIAPLGKLIMWTEDDQENVKIESLENLMDKLNSDLGFTISFSDELNEKEKYQIVTEELVQSPNTKTADVTKWLTKSVLVTTSRSTDCLFNQHYQSLKTEIRHRFKVDWQVKDGPFLWELPFNGLPLSKEDHFKIEIPHENMQGHAHKYFYLPANFIPDKRLS